MLDDIGEAAHRCTVLQHLEKERFPRDKLVPERFLKTMTYFGLGPVPETLKHLFFLVGPLW